MQAFEIPNLRFSLPAGAAIAQNRFVTVDANGLAIQSALNGNVIGVAKNEVTNETSLPATNQIAEIQDGIVCVEASAAIVAGSVVASDADGKAVTLVEGGTMAGIAITNASATGVQVSVKITY